MRERLAYLSEIKIWDCNVSRKAIKCIIRFLFTVYKAHIYNTYVHYKSVVKSFIIANCFMNCVLRYEFLTNIFSLFKNHGHSVDGTYAYVFVATM